MRDDHRKPLGRRGESVASEALRDHGYRILEQNYVCLLGEIDIVARKGRTLVFIEVKSDSGGRGILPKERVNKRKQRNLFQIAQFYIKEKRLQGISARFDVLQVRLDGEIRAVEVIANAFDVHE